MALPNSQQCAQKPGKQHPGVHACSVINDKQLHYLEAYIDKDKDDNDLATNGVIFGKSKAKVCPCRVTDVKATYIDLISINFPPLSRKEVLEGSQQSLASFGHVVDVSILTEPVTGIFLDAGYAVLAIVNQELQSPATASQDQLIKHQLLGHNIPWCEDQNGIFHATWNNMPTWCRYCHQTDHTKFECEKSKARIICYSFNQLGASPFWVSSQEHCQPKQET